MEGKGRMRFTDLLVCSHEICMQRVKQRCAVQDAEEMEKGKS